jgi:hypothetical protein
LKRVFISLLWFLTTAVVSSAQVTAYFPQVANGIQNDGVKWTTTIFVSNPAASGSSAATGTITFTASNGASLPISFVDSNGSPAGTGTISFAVSGGQTRKFVSTGTGALSAGFGTLSASTTVIGMAVFSEFTAGGALICEAAYQAVAATTRRHAGWL